MITPYDVLIELSKSDVLSHDEVNLDEAALKLPSLIQRWSEIQYYEEVHLHKMQKAYIQMKKIMWEYYNGKLSQEDLVKYNLSQFPHRIMKKDMEVYLNADPNLLQMDDEIVMQSKKLGIIERKMKELASRQWSIKAAIDYRKFLSGA